MNELPNLISLGVKCPVCGHSLMDEKRPVDNCPSIRLNMKVGDKPGIIYLSSVWESYNFISTIEIPGKEIIELSCPHCNSVLQGKSDCELCGAPMIPMELDLGGDVCICSRMGCGNHFVKFVDFSFALKQLYIEAGHQGRPYVEDMEVPKTPAGPATEEEERIETMRTGTFLKSYCPHCKESLIEDWSIKLKVDRGDEEGLLMLSPYLNIFTSRSTIRLPEDELIENILCPHCNHSLVITGEECGECGSQVARIVVGATSRLVDFYICSRKGCTWHGLSREDIDHIRLEGSLEW
jgi:ssDNA-binding Zn-finger/Zn-ribbon topoisomerase 1